MHNARHKFSKAKTLFSLMVFLSVLCGPALNMSLPKEMHRPPSSRPGKTENAFMFAALVKFSLITWREKVIFTCCITAILLKLLQTSMASFHL